MARNKSEDNSFRDLVARLNAMSNITPEQERASLMEAAKSEPKVLDDKDISLADIARLAGIKEYVEPIKVSKKAQKRLDKIADLETQLAELKAEQKEEQTYDSKAFREVISTDIAEYIKNAEEGQLVELYNSFSDNEAIYNEEQKSILVKTPETTEIIADAEKAEAPEEEVVQEKEPEERLVDLDKEVLPDPGTPSVETPAVEDEGEEVELDAVEPAIDVPAPDKFTNDLDPAPKTESKK